jgi:hypothetical protein
LTQTTKFTLFHPFTPFTPPFSEEKKLTRSYTLFGWKNASNYRHQSDPYDVVRKSFTGIVFTLAFTEIMLTEVDISEAMYCKKIHILQIIE